MNDEIFAERICDEVLKKLGDGYRVALEEIHKNNGVVGYGIQISRAGQNLIPTVKLEPLQRAYEQGVSSETLIDCVIAAYRGGEPIMGMQMDFFRDFEKVKDNICYRLINRQRNRELLKQIPHKSFLDLAVCFHYVCQGELDCGTILLYNSHLEMWGITIEELDSLAEYNTPRLCPWEYKPLNEILREFEGIMTPEEREYSAGITSPVWILRNKTKLWGASSILCPGVLGEISKGKNLFVIPSSVKEMTILPDDGQQDIALLKWMLMCENMSTLLPEDVLSDNIYYYDASADEIRII